MPIKNQATTICYFAEDVINGGGKTGDVANHTIKVAADGVLGTVAASPTEVDPTNLKGVYKIVIASGENTGDNMLVGGISSSTGIVIRPAQWTNVVNLKGWLNTTVPTPNTAGYPLVDIAKVNGTAASTYDGQAQAGSTSSITRCTACEAEVTRPPRGAASSVAACASTRGRGICAGARR